MKQYYVVWIMCWTLLGSIPAGLAQPMQYHRISLKISPERLEHLLNNGLAVDHFSYENKANFTADISEADVQLFRRNGINVTYLVRNLEKNYRKYNEQLDREVALNRRNTREAAVSTPANFSLGSFGGHYTFAELVTILDRMRALYPTLISTKTSIGTSTDGRPLYMVRISDNPDVDENEPEVLLNALHHAREPMSLSQLVFFMWHMLENYSTDKEIRTLLNSSELYIVPCVNPDGYVYNQTTNPGGGGLWRKNRKAISGGSFGVDLNRTYAYNFGVDISGSSPTPTSETYRGTGAFSEVETAALRDLAVRHQFVTTFSYHAYGNVCIYPFESTAANTNPELSTFQKAAAYLTAENGFRTGNPYQTIGYTANGSTLDWSYGEQVAKGKIYGFTPEIGTSADGFWPASSRIVPLSNTMIDMNRKLLRISTYYGRASVRGPVLVNKQMDVLRYRFQNFGIIPARFTVTATSLSRAIIAVGPAKTHTGLALLESVPDSIAFTVAANTPTGTQLPFELAVDNGLSVIRDTVTLTFITDAIPPLGTADLQVLAFPNPFEETIRVNVNESEQETSVRLIGVTGQIYRQITIPATETDRTIPAIGLPSGAYLIEVIRENQRKVIQVRKP